MPSINTYSDGNNTVIVVDGQTMTISGRSGISISQIGNITYINGSPFTADSLNGNYTPKIKYEIINGRIKALINIPEFNVSIGDVGGKVNNKNDLDQFGSWWIDYESSVLDNSVISGSVFVKNSTISGRSRISGSGNITNSVINNSNVSGSGDIRESEIFKSNISGSGNIIDSKVNNSNISGSGDILDSEVYSLSKSSSKNIYKNNSL